MVRSCMCTSFSPHKEASRASATARQASLDLLTPIAFSTNSVGSFVNGKVVPTGYRYVRISVIAKSNLIPMAKERQRAAEKRWATADEASRRSPGPWGGGGGEDPLERGRSYGGSSSKYFVFSVAVLFPHVRFTIQTPRTRPSRHRRPRPQSFAAPACTLRVFDALATAHPKLSGVARIFLPLR